MLRRMKTTDAVGHTLCQDLTQIVKDVSKGPLFKRGHILTQEDIPQLLAIGKKHVYVWDGHDDIVHEEDAARFLYQLCAGANIQPTAPSEGKIECLATCDGLLQIDLPRLNHINTYGDMMVATIPTFSPVKKGQRLAATRIIPLFIEQEKLDGVKQLISGQPVLSVTPYTVKRVAVVTTGSEVFNGLIDDTFTPVIQEKLQAFPAEMIAHYTVDDVREDITAAINKALAQGADIILCTGGMSVDPDDLTPGAIKQTGADIISYGTPVFPGAMFLLAYTEAGQVIMGLPGSVMYEKQTVFDMIFPRVMADVAVSAADIAALGHGGLL